MRRILAACVLLAPLVVSANAIAAQPASDASDSTTTRPVSSGVTPPRVLSSSAVDLSSSADEMLPNFSQVVVTLNVDQNGQPQDVQVLKSPNYFLDEPVAAAVRKFRFSPATLNNKPVTTDMTLTVNVQR